MGMAASQARYLELTARKSNVEYEGQQINQQRVDLANQSAGLFTQLMGLNVPTPPSTSDYTTLQYSFNDGTTTETITNMTKINNSPNYNYNVTYTHNETQYTGIQNIKTTPGVTLQPGPPATYWIQNGTFKTTVYNPTTDAAAVSQIMKNYPAPNQFTADFNADPNNIFSYQSGGTTYYVCKTDLDNCRATPSLSLNQYYAANLDKPVTTTENAYVTQDNSGRLSSIQLSSSPSTTFALNTKSTTNENAYNDAMNQYTYQQQQYEQTVNSINAKTSIIQQQDRTLELRLRQCDTEQQALSTEMDAVKKVIDKNIESTFKTFAN